MGKAEEWEGTQGLLEEYARKPVVAIRNRIVTKNLGLCHKEAKRWQRICAEPYDDLLQIGTLGLISAVENFELASGNRFSSFACPRISGAIQHYLRDKGWGVVRPPRKACEDYSRVMATQRRLTAMGRDESPEAIAQGLGISTEQWEFIKQAREMPAPSELDDSIPENGPDDEASFDADRCIQEIYKLPDPPRTYLIERIWGGLSNKAIAKRHNTSELAVDLAIATGINHIKASLCQR